MKVSGLIIGTRKAGTTWLYENLLRDSSFCVSSKVKESGFFAGENGLAYQDYETLYDPINEEQYIVEVDSSICYSGLSENQINLFAPEAKVVLILRDPAEYLASRYTHSYRKGEVSQDNVLDAFKENEWLRDELDYEKILKRYEFLNKKGKLLVMSFELLKEDEKIFYQSIVSFITGGKEFRAKAFLEEEVNVARDSRLPILSKLLSNCAKLARKYGFHEVVNISKRTGILSFLDNKVDDLKKTDLVEEARNVIINELPTSIREWKRINQK